MRRTWIVIVVIAILGIKPSPVRADFSVTTQVIEFTAVMPAQQDIELVSRSPDTQYIETQVTEIIDPGQEDERRVTYDDPSQSGLLVTPDKTVLAANGRRVLRFVLLKQPDSHEHIYRVAVKPVIKGLDNSGKIGLKILVGYEILVIVRPSEIHAAYTTSRKGKTLSVSNTGNTDILLQSSTQCKDAATCKPPPVLRVYPNTSATAELPVDMPVTYSIWDGDKTTETQIP